VIWRGQAVGLPLVPTVAIQHLFAYGVPIATNHEMLSEYPANYLAQAGGEVCLFLVIMAVAWRMGMQLLTLGSAYAYVLRLFDSGQPGRIRVALILVGGTTAYQIMAGMNLLWFIFDLLPNGTYSLVSALINATTLAGYFLFAMQVGAGVASPLVRIAFWGSLLVNLLLLSSTFLLSAPISLVTAVLIGLFWSSGRIPWLFLAFITAFVSFLHLGKFEMRDRYWANNDDEAPAATTLADLPSRYSEWAEASYENLVGAEDPTRIFGPEEKSAGSMLDRVNVLQNLLFAIDAVDYQRAPTLDGATYALIPPLLIPRVLWPDKPRSHEGQILLNTHFGRQSLSASFKTYIAWGLLPEAYGNFGNIWGAIILGTSLGLLFAWMENATVNKPVLSLEGMITFAVFASITISFEMVSSVLVTSIFQTSIVITLACLPFVDRTLVVRSGNPGP